MVGETEQRRVELRERLIEIAEAEVEKDGPDALRARRLAEQAGCAVGAIYNVFPDLNALVLSVNMRTFKRLEANITNCGDSLDENATPHEKLVAMADTYLDFATENLNLWRAMFQISLTAEHDVPEWYLSELNGLFDLISLPIVELDPSASHEEIQLRTRTVFSGVHGVMLLSLERRISGIPQSELKRMIGFFLENFCAAAPGASPAP